jgi:hypothetical protein
MQVQEQLNQIIERNNRVELEKAWETSATRKLVIVSLTYIVTCAFLYTINEPIFLLKALVPVAGYILSTLSIPKIKKIWQDKIYHTIKT